MAGACSCESCLGKELPWKGLRKGLKEAFDGGQIEFQRPEKQMAGACSCESCLGKACGRV